MAESLHNLNSLLPRYISGLINHSKFIYMSLRPSEEIKYSMYVCLVFGTGLSYFRSTEGAGGMRGWK